MTAYAGHGCMTLTQRRIRMAFVYSEHTECTFCTSTIEFSILELATTSLSEVLKQGQSTSGTSVHTMCSTHSMLRDVTMASLIHHIEDTCHFVSVSEPLSASSWPERFAQLSALDHVLQAPIPF